MSDDTIKVRLWQMQDSAAAYQFSTTPREGRDGKQVWIPKSQIEHISRRPDAGGWRECTVTMPFWIANKKGIA